MNFRTGWKPTTLTQNSKLNGICLGSQLNELIASIKGIYDIETSDHRNIRLSETAGRGAFLPMIVGCPDNPMFPMLRVRRRMRVRWITMGRMQPTDRDFLVQRLHETRDAFLASFQGVSEKQACFKAAPDRWSICDCVEHMAVAETGLFRQLSENSVPAEAPPASREPDVAILNSNGGNRDQKARAPERACPTGRFGSLAQAAKQFTAAPPRTIDYIIACDDVLSMHI